MSYTNKDLTDFKAEMKFQLRKHEFTKTDLKDHDLAQVFELTTEEIHQRLQRILTEGPEVMERQCVHIANYCMFLYSKLQEVKK